MKNKATLTISLIVIVLLAGTIAYRMFILPRPGYAGDAGGTPQSGLINRIAGAVFEPEPSPYSIKWGAQMARIVDQAGNGVPEATITFTKNLSKDREGNFTETPPDWQGTTVVTNEKGEFEYPLEIWNNEDSEKKPTIDMSIEAVGFLKRNNINVGINYADDNGLIDIFRTGRIEGAVMDPDGGPLANVPLWLSTHTYYKNPGASCSGCFGANITTDEAGGFVIEDVPPGMHILKFPGNTGSCNPEPETEPVPFKEYATFQMINMEDGQVKTDVFIDLRQSRGTIKGRVVDKYNRPMAGVNALLRRVIKTYFDDGSGWSSSTENLKSVETDENGNYVLTHIPPGDYQLQAQYPSEQGKNYKAGDPLDIYLAGQQEITFNLVLERQDNSLPKPAPGQRSLFEVPLPQGLVDNEIMIVDPRGNGVVGATVIFNEGITLEDKKTHQQERLDWPGVILTTDQRGVFTLPEELQPREDQWVQGYLKVSAEGFDQRHIGWFRPSNLDKDPRIDILPVSTISGQLIGPDGKPAKGRVEHRNTMVGYRNPNSSISGGGSYSSRTTDDEGRFTFEKFAEGAHFIYYSAQDPDSKSDQTGGIVVYPQQGQDISDLVIDLRQDVCTVAGHVLDRNGKPVKGAVVKLTKSMRWGYNSYATSWVELGRSEPTNRKGEFIIEHIHPGVYEIEAETEGDNSSKSDKKTIALGEGQDINIDIRLNR